MQYSFNKITMVPACNALLAKAQKVKQTLERKRRNLGEAIDTFRGRMDRMAREGAEVQALLSAFTTCYHALPEGKHKVGMNVKIKRLELRQARLELKSSTYNVRALLAKQVKYNGLDQKVVAMGHYITAMQNHRAALVGAPEPVSQEVAVLRLPVVRQKLSTPKNTYRFKRRFLKMPSGPSQLVFEGDEEGFGQFAAKTPSGWGRALHRDR